MGGEAPFELRGVRRVFMKMSNGRSRCHYDFYFSVAFGRPSYMGYDEEMLCIDSFAEMDIERSGALLNC